MLICTQKQKEKSSNRANYVRTKMRVNHRSIHSKSTTKRKKLTHYTITISKQYLTMTGINGWKRKGQVKIYAQDQPPEWLEDGKGEGWFFLKTPNHWGWGFSSVEERSASKHKDPSSILSILYPKQKNKKPIIQSLSYSWHNEREVGREARMLKTGLMTFLDQ